MRQFVHNLARFFPYSQVMPVLEQFGLRVWRGAVTRMRDLHQHTEVELNLCVRGQMTYRFGARETTLGAGAWMLFWGALPHILVIAAPRSECIWITLPLADFLRWDLPADLATRVLHGEPVHADGDLELFARWAQDWLTPHADTARIVTLELEARLRRLAHGQAQARPAPRASPDPDRASVLAQHLAEHCLEPLSMPAVAAAAGLHPNYAAGLFKRHFGMTMLEFLTQHRVAHAQRLLATTGMGVLEVALESGFGSTSRFYAAFERATGCSPSAYRRAMGGGDER
jgi:AraC-like DNA-binding protein